MDSVLTAEEVANMEAEALLTYPSLNGCTYAKGYETQMVHSCFTCSSSSSEGVGVCETCAVTCHTDHDVRPIWRRRDFRCDCGTPGTPPCCAGGGEPVVRTEKNKNNVYNKNFADVYCMCHRLYDHEGTNPIMFQCLVCQDWFHDECLANVYPVDLGLTLVFPEEGESDLICPSCTSSLYPRFLGAYISAPSIALSPHLPASPGTPRHKRPRSPSPGPADPSSSSTTSSSSTAATSAKRSKSLQGTALTNAATSSQCLLKDYAPALPRDGVYLVVPPTKLESMCTCPSCLQMYDELNVSFLLRLNDEAEEEQEHDHSPGNHAHGQGVEAEEDEANAAVDAMFHMALQGFLSSIPQDQSMLLAVAKRAFLDAARDGLRPFAQSGQVVTESDIRTIVLNARDAMLSTLS